MKVPCAEHTGGEQLRLDDGVDPKRGGWQLLFRGLGTEVRFNALPLTFYASGELVAQVIAVRADGLDWHGLFVPEPAPATPEEADARFGVDSEVGAVMRQVAKFAAGTSPGKLASVVETARNAMPSENRASRRRHAALARKTPRGGASSRSSG